MTSLNLSQNGPPETVLAPERDQDLAALASALQQPEPSRRAAVAEVVANSPKFLDAWSQLGNAGRDVMESYSAYRVGYHRGLDTLRQNGWRGSGYVRWEHESNRGFLRALAGLQATAAQIGEMDEAERCYHFLLQLDPSWPPADFG